MLDNLEFGANSVLNWGHWGVPAAAGASVEVWCWFRWCQRCSSVSRRCPAAVGPAGHGDVPHPRPLWGGCSSWAAGCWQSGCPQTTASSQCPCVVCDQPPPGHTWLVLSGFGWPWAGTGVQEPFPMPVLVLWVKREVAASLAGGCCPWWALVAPSRSEIPVLPTTATLSSLGQGAFASPPWAPACHSPQEAQLISGVQIPAAWKRGEDVPGTGSGRNGGGRGWKWSGALGGSSSVWGMAKAPLAPRPSDTRVVLACGELGEGMAPAGPGV